MGKYIVLLGGIIMVIGLIIWVLGPRLGWFGHLPGDIRVEKPGFRFYAPITTMLLLSILFSLILWLVRRFFG